MDLRQLVRTAGRGWKTVVSFIIVALLLGFGYAAFQAPVYQSTARVYVEVELPSDSSATALEQSAQLSKNRTITYKALANTSLILSPVISKLGLDVDVPTLASQVTALAPLDTSVIDVIVNWKEPGESAEIANAIAREMVERFSTRPSSGSDPQLSLVEANKAIPPSRPLTPNAPLIVGLCVFIGILLSLAWIYGRRAYSPRIFGAEDLSDLGAPVLGIVPRETRKFPADVIEKRVNNIARTILAIPPVGPEKRVALVPVEGSTAASSVALAGTVSAALSAGTSADTGGTALSVVTTADVAHREPFEPDAVIDSAIVIVTSGRTSARDLHTALTHLDTQGIPVIGFILNDASAMDAGAAIRSSSG